jgi:hypothetical protein
MACPESPTAGERLPRGVIVLSWVSLFQDAASEMLYRVMPLFLTRVLGAARGGGRAHRGSRRGRCVVDEAVASLMKPLRR